MDLDLAGMLRRPEVAYGTLMLSSLPTFATALAGTGADFVFIDTEHVPLDRGLLESMCFAYRQLGLPPLVRVPKADAVLARAVIDAGACGVVASYMETVKEVQELRKAVKLKPLQGELLRVALNEPERFELEHGATKAFIDGRQKACALVINVESQAAIDNLDAMLAVPGVDAVLVGPHDLSCNLGVPEDFESPVFQSALRTIFGKARAAHVGAGIHQVCACACACIVPHAHLRLTVTRARVQFAFRVPQGMPPTTPGMTPQYAAKWIAEYGCNVYVHSADVGLFSTQLKRDLGTIRDIVGDAPHGEAENGGDRKRARKDIAVPVI